MSGSAFPDPSMYELDRVYRCDDCEWVNSGSFINGGGLIYNRSEAESDPAFHIKATGHRISWTMRGYFGAFRGLDYTNPLRTFDI